MHNISSMQREFMPLPSEFVESICDHDQFLLAFPRSGSRWIRMVLADALNESHGFGSSDFYDRHVTSETGQVNSHDQANRPSSKVIPDAHWQAHASCVLPSLGLSAVFRSHHLADALQRSQGNIAYTFRHPVSSLYSYYHFARQQNAIHESTTMEQFCTGRLELWMDHVATMLQAYRHAPDRVLFLTYQDTDGPFTHLQIEACAAHFNLPIASAFISAAISRQKDFLAKVNAHPNTPHGRGGNHHVLAEMPVELQNQLTTKAQEIYEAAKITAAESLDRVLTTSARTAGWLG